jgi:hypothetical protein
VGSRCAINAGAARSKEAKAAVASRITGRRREGNNDVMKNLCGK